MTAPRHQNHDFSLTLYLLNQLVYRNQFVQALSQCHAVSVAQSTRGSQMDEQAFRNPGKKYEPVNQHERVSFRDVESLHRRELVTPCSVRDLQRTYVLQSDTTFIIISTIHKHLLISHLVATDHLTVRIFDRRNVRVLKRVCFIYNSDEEDRSMS